MPQAAILLVDDDVELLKALTKTLEREGYHVVPQPDAPTAIEHVQRTREHFDLVITDVSMPQMPGLEFLNKLKAAFPRLPVIVITGFGDWGPYMDAMRAGAFAYLSKPINKIELLSTVGHALKKAA
jgi:DNA-binding NtrC family response regulator